MQATANQAQKELRMKTKSLLLPKQTLAILAIICLTMLSSISLHAVTLYSKAAGGNWNSVGTWTLTSGGSISASIPIATDIVIIEGGATVTVPTGSQLYVLRFL